MTYFESKGVSAGDCGVKICKSDPTVCQIRYILNNIIDENWCSLKIIHFRLDFINFVIDGPSINTATIGNSNKYIIKQHWNNHKNTLKPRQSMEYKVKILMQIQMQWLNVKMTFSRFQVLEIHPLQLFVELTLLSTVRTN